ncbi:hypothetical protein [Endozoicomonas numazuensis]|uniref:Bacterial virulence factor lipase N-terminal domain-containing protein n=1 Tax=Endozoicomonas numazuensis TaxID=1137799 RepID=A0A081NE68_9GAMM|nr:hypothetical protein [Endozoicomonas numazuensis]KEQ16741.1 hypothetical protein GZ78_18790 [Endozoicomonas numazuensis]
MQYSRLARAVSLTLPFIFLAGCDENNVDEVTLSSQTLQFDPAKGVIPYPNDIVGFDEDGTLHIPGETDWANTAGDSPNVYWNYYGAQKGWGTSVPMVLEFKKAAEEAGGSPTIDGETLQAGIKMYKEDGGILKSLEWNKDYRAILAKSGTINIEPLKPLDEATRYFVVMTSGVKDAHGQTLKVSSAYQQLLSSKSDMGLHLQGVIDTLGGAGISPDDIVYAADFTTGSNISVIRPVIGKYLDEYSSNTHLVNLEEEVVSSTSNIGEENTLLTQLSDQFEKKGLEVPETEPDAVPEYRVFSAAINLPAYLDTPEIGVNCEYNEYVSSMQEGGANDSHPENFNEYRVAPQAFCPGAFSYFQTDDGTPINASNAADIHVFKEPYQNLVKAKIYLPAGPVPENGFKVVMSSHGFGSSKDEAELFAKQLVGAGYALVAIDHPMHGERTVDIDGDDVADLDASVRRTDYASPENLLTTRGFMWQVSMDYIGIRMAIANGVEDDQGQVLLDNKNVHMMGSSLGGIHSTIISGMIRDAQEHFSSYADDLDIKTTVTNVPGGNVAAVLMQSPVLLPEMKADILESGPFRLYMAEKLGIYNPEVQLSRNEKVAALDKADEYRNIPEGIDLSQPELIDDNVIRQMANKMVSVSQALGNKAATDFAEFEEQVWQAYKIPAEIAYQTIIDPSDPVSYAKVLSAYKDEPVLMSEAVGDGSNDLSLLDAGLALKTEGHEWNPGDFVIVNQADEMPLGGGDAVIRAMELDLLTGGVNGEEGSGTIRGASRYAYGTHLSSFVELPLAVLDPDLLPNDHQVHNSIVNATLSFLNSNGSSVTVNNGRPGEGSDKLLVPAEDFPEQPEYKFR